MSELPNKIDAVLLDDDPLVHMMWKMAARQSARTLVVLSRKEELRAILSELPRNTAIYLDSDLGAQGRGEDIGAELAAAGYSELYLVTGYEPGRFAHLKWLKGILDKRAPWVDMPK